MTIPAGWYNDGGGQLRWWDGAQWTTHTTPVPTPAPEPAPTPQVPAPPAPPEEIPDADDAPAVETVASVFDPPPVADAALIPPVPGASAPRQLDAAAQLGAVASSAMPTSVLPPEALALQAEFAPPAAPEKPKLPLAVAAYDKARRSPNFSVFVIAVAAVAIVLAFIWAMGIAGSAPRTVSSITAPTATAIAPSSPSIPGSPAPLTPNPWAINEASDDEAAALAKAQEYADWGELSKMGIYDRLTDDLRMEYFTPDAAQFAIDNLVADWNAHALQAAQGYSDYGHVSLVQMRELLEDPIVGGFTPDEVQYALDNVAADFKANALEAAREIQEIMPNFTLDDIRRYLSSVDFTDEEVQHAIDNL